MAPRFAGATWEHYDQVSSKIGLTLGGPGPAGALGHWVAATDGGILVPDLWQTKELYDAFAKDQIGAFSAEVGIPAPPTVKYLYFTPGAGDSPTIAPAPCWKATCAAPTPPSPPDADEVQGRDLRFASGESSPTSGEPAGGLLPRAAGVHGQQTLSGRDGYR